MIKHWLSGKLGYEFFQKNQQIGTYTTRTYEKNTVISLFQKLECKIFFKKTTILDSTQFCEDFYIFVKIARLFWYHCPDNNLVVGTL